MLGGGPSPGASSGSRESDPLRFTITESYKALEIHFFVRNAESLETKAMTSARSHVADKALAVT
jgi:hypothetical protein